METICIFSGPAFYSVTTPHAGFSFLNLGINEISEDVYTAVEHSDSEDSEKSDSSDSEYISDDEQKSKNEPDDPEEKEGSGMDKEPPAAKKKPKPANPVEVKEELKSPPSPASEKAEPGAKASPQPEKGSAESAKPSPHPTKDKLKGKDETDSPTVHLGLDSDSESELVIDLGEDHSGREGRKNKKEPKEPPPKQDGKCPRRRASPRGWQSQQPLCCQKPWGARTLALSSPAEDGAGPGLREARSPAPAQDPPRQRSDLEKGGWVQCSHLQPEPLLPHRPTHVPADT